MNLSDYTDLSWKELLNKIGRGWYDLPRLIKELATRLSKGSNIFLDSSKFENNLSKDDDTVQKAFETIDKMSGGGGSINLSTTQTSSSVTIVNSGGDNATIPIGNGTNAGVSINNYTTSEKNKLSGIASGATVIYAQTFIYPDDYPFVTTNTINGIIDIQIEHSSNFDSYFEVNGNEVTSIDSPDDIMFSDNKVKIIYK